MTKTSNRFPPEACDRAVRIVEELLAARGIEISHETVRQ